ncbi:M20 family metallopeptidase [Oceanobacter mangrovi]|uniref:M20 family metallopeptidase n=1 Tax=Oceanobacter mangrovi TaxID=2862510 RepID=UPI001C8D175B|nr:acetylornithine deacetylase [Oceanobacter mangrovi]
MNRPQFTEQQWAWYQQACARINPARLQQRLFELTDIHSPTGATRAASEYMVNDLQNAGLNARYQPMSEITGNVLAELPGSGNGASLLLYAPIDTHLERDGSDELLTGKAAEADMQPYAQQLPDWVFGLGASNPKAMVATLAEIARALIEADIPLQGNLLVGMADGGMPVDISARGHAGMSNGVLHLLNRGGAADFAIVMKPWNWVYHEEPGMGWFKVRVKGTLGYAGVPHDLPEFRSSVVPAATVIQEIERWLPEYAERNTSGVIRPYGWIAGVQGGDCERPAFPSAVTEIFLDLRINPRTSPANVKHQFGEFIDAMLQRHPEIELEWQMYGTVPGGTTDPDNWIIQSCIRGWEQLEQRPYSTPDLLGGQTDGTALRRYGIPTARIGWPWPAKNPPLAVAEGLGGMGATYIPDLIPCAEKILYAVIDTLTRPRHELGL